jgi:hypothetical protein
MLTVVEYHERPPRRQIGTGGLQRRHSRQRTHPQHLSDRRADQLLVGELRQLEPRFAEASDDESAAVRCPQAIGPDRTVRCELRYAASAPRPLLVRLSPRGELEAVVPAAATLKR